jgi:predicted Rossmann fold nucleotide-binding protein DprA/Smf involved in DNA uptake
MPNYSEAAYWLALINESGLKLGRVKPIVQRWCVTEQRPLAELFDLSPLDWATTFGLAPAEAERALAARRSLDTQARLLTQWQAQGIETVIRTNPRYPKRLAFPLPPVQQPLVLWAQGRLELLSKPAVTLLGSDSPDETTTPFITELTTALAAEEIGLVSGYTKGLDRAAFDIMLDVPGGHTVAVLPMGLAAFNKTTAKLAPAVTAGKTVLVSPFAPDTPFDEKLAEARTLLIDHLALTLLVIQPDEAVQSRALDALNRGVPVLMRGAASPTPAHSALLEQGAFMLTDPGEVIEMVQQAVIDSTLLETDADEFSPTPLPPPNPPSPGTTDDYALHLEDVGPIDLDEAANILSMGGDIPDKLRHKLQQLKKKSEK